jgi:hypothetical protein
VASAKAKAAIRPYVLLPQNLCKGGVALLRMFGCKAGRRTLWAFISEPCLRTTVPLGELVRDVLKLAVVGQVPQGKASSMPFEIQTEFHPQQGALVFVSQPVRLGQTPSNCNLTAAATQQVQTMVWNHSAVGGKVRYSLWPGCGLSVCVGDYDLHTFAGFIEFARRRPHLAWELCANLIEPRNVALNSSSRDSTR